jgi:glucosylceramidase
MNNRKYLLLHFTILLMLTSACQNSNSLKIEVFETSAGGNKLTKIVDFQGATPPAKRAKISIDVNDRYQTITGFGGSFTEASAYLLNQLSEANRNKILQAYFGESGARYSLTRTHMNSCDFSLGNYSYASVEGDIELEHFTIEEDMEDIIPMIKDAQAISKEGFKILSSPWTAPPWMKDNKDWRGGKLLPEYYNTWALFFSKYLTEYQKQGIDIWGFTVENEPLGNDNNWESMHYTPEEMNEFVKNHLGPKLEADGHDVKILGYDQNRDHELKAWVDAMYDDSLANAYYDGTAVHWYASTYDYFPEALQYAHSKAPEKHLIQTEGCVDAEVPRWQDDEWYWAKEATDWGWDWAPADQKYLHPKYAPSFRYARDIIGSLNNWVDGWIDWNMVLDRQGGPNWFENWCVAPVIVDPELDEVYFTPIFYVMTHFSRFIRPDAVRIGFENSDEDLMVTAIQNPDGGVVLIVFNQTEQAKEIELTLGEGTTEFSISSKAIQTILLSNSNTDLKDFQI